MAAISGVDLHLDKGVQDAIDEIIEAHATEVEKDPYLKVEVSVFTGDDEGNCNRIAFYEVSRRSHSPQPPF